MLDISFLPLNDTGALEHRWLALEAVSQGGFFRSWSYLGTLLPHFAAPHLLAVRDGGQDLALGLLNVTRRWNGTRATLHEAGRQPWDSLYVEHNGLLLRPGAEPCLAAALAAVARHGALTLAGIDTAHLHAAQHAGQVTHRSTSYAPAIDLAALNSSGQSHLDALSANARAQIRRALRLYGPELAITLARDVPEAHMFFDRLVSLHQTTWIARGKPGAFAAAPIRDWHARLIQTALPRREVALLRVAAGARDIGFLYQFQHGGCVLNYQAGLAPETDARLKPGLVCHALAIEHARETGALTYDFLAGAQRYKTTLVPRGQSHGQNLHWISLNRPNSLQGRLARLSESSSFLKTRTKKLLSLGSTQSEIVPARP